MPLYTDQVDGEWRRRRLLMQARAYVTETYPRANATQQSVLNAGFQYAYLVPFLRGERITGVDVGCHTAAVTPTLIKAAFASLDMATIRAVTADRSADFASTGMKPLPMITPYDVPDDVVLRFLFVAVGGTPPSMDVGMITGKNGNGSNRGIALYSHKPGMTDITTGTGGEVVTASSVPIWAGVY